jgi:hypothetical protein
VLKGPIYRRRHSLVLKQNNKGDEYGMASDGDETEKCYESQVKQRNETQKE